MFSLVKKLLLPPFLLVLVLLGTLASGLFQAAYCESAPRATLYAYIHTLYYATSLKQVSKYWIKNARVPMDECLGTAAQTRLTELKNGYIYNPQIQSELLDGNVCTLKGIGIAQQQGYRVNAKLDAIMRYEEGSWKIQYYNWQSQIPGHY